MTMINHRDFERPEDMIGLDVEIDPGAILTQIGFISDVTYDTDSDGEIDPESIVLTVQEHLEDNEYTFTGLDHLGHLPPNLSVPRIGKSYSVERREHFNEDGEWVPIERGEDITGRTRIVTEEYEVGMDHTQKFALRASNGRLTTVLEGRCTLAQCIGAIGPGESAQIYIDHDGITSLLVKFTDAEPELPIKEENELRADTSKLEPTYEITGADQFSGTVTIKYNNEQEHATVTRKAPDQPLGVQKTWPIKNTTDPGDFEYADLRGIGVSGSPNEFYDLPWLNQLRQKVNIPENFGGKPGTRVGSVYITPNNKFEVHHISIDRSVMYGRETVNDLINVQSPYTLKVRDDMEDTLPGGDEVHSHG